LITTIVLTAVFFHFLNQDGSPNHGDLQFFLGTWTEEGGEPGNSIRFGFVRSPGSDKVPLIEVYDGIVEFRKHFGEEKIEAAWNYGNYRPLQLNVIVSGKCKFAWIQPLDKDHLLIRFTLNIDDASSAAVFDSPDVKRLKRIPENAAPGK